MSGGYVGFCIFVAGVLGIGSSPGPNPYTSRFVNPGLGLKREKVKTAGLKLVRSCRKATGPTTAVTQEFCSPLGIFAQSTRVTARRSHCFRLLDLRRALGGEGGRMQQLRRLLHLEG